MIAPILRKLPAFRGKRRLARLFAGKEIDTGSNLLVKGKYACSYYLPNLKESIALDIYIDGIYEQDTHDFLFSHLKKGAVMLDLGANIGSVSIPLCKRRPDIQVYGVEASPWIVEFLTKNIALNDLKNIQIINRALYTSDDEVFRFYSPKDQFGKGSLSPVFTQEGQEVRTVKVDTLVRQFNLPKVDFIKIDIEGFEFFAFKGAENLLKPADAPDILFEFADWAENLATNLKAGDAQQYLKSCGYDIYIFNGHRPMTPVPEVLGKGNYMLFASKRHQ